MHQVEKWRWRIRWAGRWATTRIAKTEAEALREHPKATKIEGTMVLVDLPESEAEVQAAHRPPRRQSGADGSIKKMWE